MEAGAPDAVDGQQHLPCTQPAFSHLPGPTCFWGAPIQGHIKNQPQPEQCFCDILSLSLKTRRLGLTCNDFFPEPSFFIIEREAPQRRTPEWGLQAAPPVTPCSLSMSLHLTQPQWPHLENAVLTVPIRQCAENKRKMAQVCPLPWKVSVVICNPVKGPELGTALPPSLPFNASETQAPFLSSDCRFISALCP